MTKANDLLLSALCFLGEPYVWGGESIKEGGFDCSGLFYAAMIKAKNKINRLSAQGYFNLYQNKLSYKTPAAGDILFFGKSKNNISHIAIAISDKEMIESIGNSKNTKYNKGKGVCISNIKRRNDLIAIIDIFDDANDIYYPKYNGNSLKIDIVFGDIGAPYGNVSKRKKVAFLNGIKNYSGTYTQNLNLIKLAKEGLLKKI